MLSFESDYIEGAHPAILEALEKTNFEPLPGYGTDAISLSAKARIREACAAPNAEVFLLSGGTSANQIVISSMLRQEEGVIAASTGHVSVHEAGAIEYTGHKVLALPSHEGRLSAEEVRAFLAAFFADANNEHMVFPGMVYISFPTELGTLYSRDELFALSAVCREFGLPLYIDGARLAYGLESAACDLTLLELAHLADVFYIGGTKCGALIGEAVVFPHGNAPKHFVTLIKQRGALLAKGRLTGIQFDVLFTDGLYFRLGRHAIEMAEKLRALLLEKGCRLYIDSPTNQQFVIMPNGQIKKLRESVAFSFWDRFDDENSIVRFCTSWATKPESIDELAKLL